MRRTNILPFLLSVIICIAGASAEYNSRESEAWPGTGEWLALARSLSTEAQLYGPFESFDYERQCSPMLNNPFILATTGEGICMQYPSCANKFCLEGAEWDDLPAYALMAKEELDIVKGIQYASKHNIQVTVKSSGHSYTGASTARDSLLIWLAHYPKDNEILEGYQDSCGTVEDQVIGINAGQNFQSIAEAVGDDYHFVSASEATVSVSGGWVLGNGLSYTSREYGLGVDNVVDFRVVLPSGLMAKADRCTNADLFWALRGGGGGTFGIVTHMTYKLHPSTPIVHTHFSLGKYAKNSAYVRKFLSYWVSVVPTLDTRFGGRFSSDSVDLFFAGNLFAANLRFLNAFEQWVEEEFDLENELVLPSNNTKVHSSWSKVLPLLSEATGTDWSTESTFSRFIPHDMAVNKPESTTKLLESLALDESMGFVNYFLGGKINHVSATETSVNPVTRKSDFLITANENGYRKLVEELPDGISGTSRNHNGGLEPNWRESIWGDNYSRLLEVKERVDPRNTLNSYQSVGYVGEERDFDTVIIQATPTATPVGTIDFTSSAVSGSLRIVVSVIVIGTAFVAL